MESPESVEQLRGLYVAGSGGCSSAYWGSRCSPLSSHFSRYAHWFRPLPTFRSSPRYSYLRLPHPRDALSSFISFAHYSPHLRKWSESTTMPLPGSSFTFLPSLVCFHSTHFRPKQILLRISFCRASSLYSRPSRRSCPHKWTNKQKRNERYGEPTPILQPISSPLRMPQFPSSCSALNEVDASIVVSIYITLSFRCSD
jgi:hypothetical protein